MWECKCCKKSETKIINANSISDINRHIGLHTHIKNLSSFNIIKQDVFINFIKQQKDEKIKKLLQNKKTMV